jgi:hypothetical protein
VSPTAAPLAIMSVVAPIAAIDVLYFHLYRFRLYAHPASRLETVTHLMRALLFGVAALLLTHHEPRGAWYWAITGLAAADFLNNLADVILEPRSRAPLGGLPPLEYVIHIVGATASGVIAGAWAIGAWPLAALPTELAPPGEVPGWLAANGHALYAGAAAMLIGEAALLIRATLRARAPAPAV